MIDFSLVKSQHYLWNIKLRSFLTDQQTHLPEVSFIGAQQCYLGRWLYAQGLMQYSNFTDIFFLEKLHQKLHQSAHKIIQYKMEKKLNLAYQELEDLKKISEELSTVLDKLEQRMSARV